MPLDSRWTAFSSGTVSATEINERISALEDFINGGIVSSDLQSPAAWVKHEHVDPADFYGSPAPRWEGVSSVLHHRRTNGKLSNAALFVDDVAPDQWVTVHGLGARLRVHPQVARTVGLEIAATWFTYEQDGSMTDDVSSVEAGLCAQFALFINGTLQQSTLRNLYAATSSEYKLSRKHHTVNFFADDVSDGIHDVSIKVKVSLSATSGIGQNAVRRHKFIWVQARNLTAKVIYL
tara:strand:+ start:386 stop:1090 length:705 start_codon:yes stop_codon:yes gene_type:complete